MKNLLDKLTRKTPKHLDVIGIFHTELQAGDVVATLTIEKYFILDARGSQVKVIYRRLDGSEEDWGWIESNRLRYCFWYEE